MKNNSLKIVFIWNVKKRIETIFNNYSSSVKEASEYLSSISEEHQDSNESFNTEECDDTSEEKFDKEIEKLVTAIGRSITLLQTVFSAVEVFVKNLYSSLNSIIAYEGTVILQSEELVKYQFDFNNSINVEGLTNRK